MGARLPPAVPVRKLLFAPLLFPSRFVPSFMKTRLLLACFLLGAAARLAAQSVEFSALAWRNLGPLRGGRSIANGGSSARPNEFYFGATGGGLWKTTDAGNTWAPVTDGQINSSSVGA